MRFIVVASLCILMAGCGCRSESGAVRNVINEYYSSVPSIDAGTLYDHAESRSPLYEHGRHAILLLVSDLRSTELSEAVKVKAVFALAGFNEEGKLECAGNVIEALIQQLRSGSESAVWADVALGELTGQSNIESSEGWLGWWDSEGRLEFELCEMDETTVSDATRQGYTGPATLNSHEDL